MNVRRDKVVRFHYVLRDAAGVELESTRDREPHAILYGRQDIISGLERAMAERAAGDRFEVSVRPEEAYGLRRDGWTQRVSKKYLRGPKRLAPGMQVSLGTARGLRTVTVHNEIVANHPEYLEPLYRGLPHHRAGEEAPGEAPVTPWNVPVS